MEHIDHLLFFVCGLFGCFVLFQGGKTKFSRQLILCVMTSVFTFWLDEGYYLPNNILHWAWSLLHLWEVIKEMLNSTLQSLETASKSPPNLWDKYLTWFHSIMLHPFDMLQGAGEVTQFCESDTINTPMTKWPFYEYSEPASPPWEADMLVPFSSSCWRLRKHFLPVNRDWQLSAALPFACSIFLIYIFCINQHAK